MEFAIAGLSAGGKSSLFEALTGATGLAGGQSTQKGTLVVPDVRVDALAKMSRSKKLTYATIQLCDSPGLSADPSGIQYNDRILGGLRDADGLVLVVRVFRSTVVPHPLGEVNPTRDIKKLLEDLRVSDLGIAEKRLEKLESLIPRLPKPERERHEIEREILVRVRQAIEEGQTPDLGHYSESDLATVRGYGLFALKPVLVVANIGDLTNDDEKEHVRELTEWGAPHGTPVVTINAALEKEIQEFPEEERADYYEEMGLPGPGLISLLQAIYQSMDLISFLTTSETESRAWPIPRGITAHRAAGVVHTDFMKGFIRADVIVYEDLIRLGSEAAARKAGLLRSEGKDHVVQDGDVILFHFSR